MPSSEIFYPPLVSVIFSQKKRAVNILVSSNLKRDFYICHVLAQVFAACHSCQLQQAERLKRVFHVYLPGNTNIEFEKALALECRAPSFTPQTKHSTAAWIANREEMQRVTAWYIYLNKCFVKPARNDGSHARDGRKSLSQLMGYR